MGKIKLTELEQNNNHCGIPGLKFNLQIGECLDSIDGAQFDKLATEPIEIRVIAEYRYFYLIELIFREKPKGVVVSKGYITAVNKAQLYCGSIKIKKLLGDYVRAI